VFKSQPGDERFHLSDERAMALLLGWQHNSSDSRDMEQECYRWAEAWLLQGQNSDQ